VSADGKEDIPDGDPQSAPGWQEPSDPDRENCDDEEDQIQDGVHDGPDEGSFLKAVLAAAASGDVAAAHLAAYRDLLLFCPFLS